MTRAPSECDSGGEAGGDRERVERALRNLRAGDRVDDSFDFLFQRFSAPLARQFVRWGAAPEEARDLNQETFQRIFQSVGTFQGGARLFESWVGWIWKIARTTWLRSERRKRAAKRPQNPQPLEGIDDMGERTVQFPAQLDRVLDREVRRQIREAVDELPEQEFNCVVLYYYQEMKTREIAVILRIAPGTVKAHLSHARAKLKDRLEEYFEFDDGHRNNLRSEEQSV